MKLSLKDLESCIEVQTLYASLCIGAQGQVPDEALQQAFHLAHSTLTTLEKQYRKRSSVEATEQMIKRCEARLGFTNESIDHTESSSSVQA